MTESRGIGGVAVRIDLVVGETSGLFKRDWLSFIRVEMNDLLNEYIDRVIERHPLRGFDAVHLASATVVNERLPDNILFACFDQRLCDAARDEGLKIFPAEDK